MKHLLSSVTEKNVVMKRSEFTGYKDHVWSCDGLMSSVEVISKYHANSKGRICICKSPWGFSDPMKTWNTVTLSSFECSYFCSTYYIQYTGSVYSSTWKMKKKRIIWPFSSVFNEKCWSSLKKKYCFYMLKIWFLFRMKKKCWKKRGGGFAYIVPP